MNAPQRKPSKAEQRCIELEAIVATQQAIAAKQQDMINRLTHSLGSAWNAINRLAEVVVDEPSAPSITPRVRTHLIRH